MTIIDELSEYAAAFREERIPIISQEKAELLLEIVTMHKPRRILEFGTASGYSGTIMTSHGAELVTIDRDLVVLDKARELFAKFGVNATILEGDGLEVGEELAQKGETFDFFFIDFEKRKYGEAFELAKRLATQGAMVVFDNAQSHKCEKMLSDISLAYTSKFYTIGDGILVVYL